VKKQANIQNEFLLIREILLNTEQSSQELTEKLWAKEMSCNKYYKSKAISETRAFRVPTFCTAAVVFVGTLVELIVFCEYPV
jgi:hypothetical protein